MPTSRRARSRVSPSLEPPVTPDRSSLRLLARHPAVRLTLATSSGAASSARRLPALARLWDGAITPLEPGVLKREADLVFLALPDAAAAEIAPR